MIESAVFLGSKKFGFELFQALYNSNLEIKWTVLCPPEPDDLRTYYDAFRNFALANNVNIIASATPTVVLDYSKSHKPDVMIVCGYYRLLPAEIFEHVGGGVWGFHNSLLPKYRGGSPLVWQMINGEHELGSSFFRFALGVDDGPVVDQVAIENSHNLTVKEASDLIEKEWVSRIPALWKNLSNERLDPQEQIHSDATYCAQRQENDGEIDWGSSALKIDAFIRAQASPYPQAFFKLAGKKVKIEKHETDNRIVYGIEGQVFEVRDNYVAICCGENTILRLTQLEIDGKTVKPRVLLPSISFRIRGY